MMFANNFPLIINQTEFCLAYNQKEKSHYDNIPFNFKGIRCVRYFQTKDMQTPLAPPSVLIQFLLMMRNVLKWMRYQFFELWGTKKNWGTKMTKNNHKSKNINRKNQKFDFSFDSVDSTSFIWILTLSKKKWFFLFKYWNSFEEKNLFGRGLYLFFFQFRI